MNWKLLLVSVFIIESFYVRYCFFVKWNYVLFCFEIIRLFKLVESEMSYFFVVCINVNFFYYVEGLKWRSLGNKREVGEYFLNVAIFLWSFLSYCDFWL